MKHFTDAPSILHTPSILEVSTPSIFGSIECTSYSEYLEYEQYGRPKYGEYWGYEQYGTLSTGSTRSIEPRNTWSAGSIRSTEPRDYGKYSQYIIPKY